MKKNDVADQSILEILSRNARVSISEIARQVHKSRTAVEARISKMEAAGIILGYKVILNEEQTFLPQNKAFIIIKHSRMGKCEEIWQQLRCFKNILECHSLFGQLDMVIKVSYTELSELGEIKDLLLANSEVIEVSISPVFKTWLVEKSYVSSLI